ncbi:MAG TPA: AbrB/MazE/SpoVT family DNA-binding domain-containing protein [Terriglobia bacterium]|nr:AbrB/MazE/SpoVT family DNA-binding domain-containing protein [Terriglobia bacterium]
MTLRAKVYPVRVGPQGRVVIPAPVRKELGLRSGDTLLCGAAGDRMVLELRRAAEEDLWAHFSGVRGSLAQELIRERRREARRER